MVLKGGFLGSLATTFNVLNAGGSLRVVLDVRASERSREAPNLKPHILNLLLDVDFDPET